MMKSAPSATNSLTSRQQQVLEFIEHNISHNGAPPTRAEIAFALGFKSANAAEEHLNALERKGAIELVHGTSRGIRIVNNNPISSTKIDEYLILPIVGNVAAGNPILAVENIEKKIKCHPSLFSKKPKFLLRVRGMSMKDAGIMDGDLLAIAPTHEVNNGQIIVARLNDEVTVKRYHKKAGNIELIPENDEFKPIKITSSDTQSFHIEGIVVGLIRKNI